MSFQLHHSNLSLRPITAGDEDLLFTIYAGTRTAEMERLADWTEGQKVQFLRMQFLAQHTWYQQNYSGAGFWIIQRCGEPVGRLYLHTCYQPGDIRIIDIALLPAWRNQGIGSSILGDITAFAQARDKSVSIHVESFNPAKKLYQKLGFRFVSATNGVYHLMKWKVPQTVYHD
ncbi:MAG TPA: GNAT family N-acetyltransferase [Flavisolibacter sp.]|nr:GNAT family N-acetyltransferase [Flavisolibacter sp.]